MKTNEDLIKEELIKTTKEKHYNGWDNSRTSYGYHSYNIDDINIVGQRTPKNRIFDMSKFIDFKNKKVLDLGCNVGAMLHHLENIERGIGLDYDGQCVETANNISKILGKNNLLFKKHDFDIDTFDELSEKIEFNPDIIFILSLGSWVKKWRELYEFCTKYNSIIVLEINNEIEGKEQIEFFKHLNYTVELIIDNSLDDTTNNNNRRTYKIYK
jgi:SAM-dependent methyltransferase